MADEIQSGEFFAAQPTTGTGRVPLMPPPVADGLGAIKLIMGAGVALAGIVAAFVIFMFTTYAKADDMKKLEATIENHGSRISTLEALTSDRLKRLEDRQDKFDAQQWEIAKAVGARLVTPPPPSVPTIAPEKGPRR